MSAAARSNSAPSAIAAAIAADKWGRTDLEVSKVSYLWTISNFSLRPEERGEFLESPTFSAEKGDLRWCLVICPKGEDEDSRNYVSLYLVLRNKGEVRAKIKLALVNARQEMVNAKESSFVVLAQDTRSGGSKRFICRDSLFDAGNGLLPDDKLTLFCEVIVVGDSVSTSGQSNAVQFKVSDCSSLSEDMGALFESSQFADVTLVCAGRDFQCHKAILGSRSRVFAAMFEHDMEERKNNRVEIKDVDPDVMADMLRFIYTGRAPNLDTMAADVLAVADKYALDGLKVICEEALCNSLTVENVSEVLILADLHSADQLKAQAINFINTHHVTDVMETSGWKQMVSSNPNLATEIFRALIGKQQRLI